MWRYKTQRMIFVVTSLLMGSMVGASLGERVQAAQVVPPTGTITSTSTPTPTFTIIPINTNTPTPTATGTPTLTPTITSTGTPILTSTPIAPPHLVISEFRSRGPGGDSDEFVELYNPTGAAVNISGWSVRRSSDCGATIYYLFVLPANATLLAGQHYLAVSSTNSSVSGADQLFVAGLTDGGGLALADPAGQTVDEVGMCISTQFHEGMNLVPLAGAANQSYERRPGGITACYDTDNNAGDFVLISPPNPQNHSSPIALCSGVVASTPTRTATLTPTRTSTRVPTEIPGFVIINEFLPHPHTDWNQDGIVNVGDEYIELINLSSLPVNIKNWRLDNGANTTAYYLPNVSILSKQILVFFHTETGIPLSDGGGTVRLVKSDGYTADIYNYSPVEAMDKTWCRLPATGFLTFACLPSPGRPNIPFNPAPATPEPTPVAVGEPICVLADTIPPAVTIPECNGFGAGIWNPLTENPFWVQERRKWEVFVE